jgi:hypothetical protein
MACCFTSILVFSLLSTGAVQAPLMVEKTPARPPEVEVRFHDGSTVPMVLHQEHLEVATGYGKLKVPIRDIRSIEFGIHLEDGEVKKIAGLVNDLASRSYKNRVAAARELIVLGVKAYPALLQAGRSTDRERARRAQEILKPLEQQILAEQLRTKDEDVIRTARFTLIGRVVVPAIRARTACFGDVELRFSRVRSLRSLGAANERETAFAGKWLEGDRPCGIFQEGHMLLLVNANGDLSTGWTTEANRLVAHSWGNLVGDLVQDGRVIAWKNGAVWKRP